MKLTTTKWTAVAALIAAGVTNVANAVPTSWTDTIDFNPHPLLTFLDPVVYTHTLEGFTPGVDTVSSYSLIFNLYDDRTDWLFGAETAVFSQPGALIDSVWFDLSGTESGGWTAQGRMQLEDSGSLTIAITSLLGDFYLGGSTLTVNGEKNPVPEPGTLALFGAALIGFGLMRRRRATI